MTLRDRARAAKKQRDSEQAQRDAEHAAHVRGKLASAASSKLGLDPGHLTGDALKPVRGSLHRFTLDGLTFIVGEYWHGNPGYSYFLAVQVKPRLSRVEWPPPRPASVSNTRWAPEGYVAVYSLAMLADAIDGSAGT